MNLLALYEYLEYPRSFGIFIIIIIFCSSCVTQRKIEYVQIKDNSEINFKNSSYKDYVLKPHDELYIQITSSDEAAANIYANISNQNLSNINAFGASLISHTINKDGYLEMPVIGKMLVIDKTVTEVTIMIKESLLNVLNQPIVSVKLVNRYISVLGEVRNAGHFVYSEDRLSLFDAIGLAGDITDYGNREKIVLIRKENGSNVRHEINLLQSNVLASDLFFVQPGDVIYVKPMKNKFWGLRQFPFAILLSSITTAILVLNYTKQN